MKLKRGRPDMLIFWKALNKPRCDGGSAMASELKWAVDDTSPSAARDAPSRRGSFHLCRRRWVASTLYAL